MNKKLKLLWKRWRKKEESKNLFAEDDKYQSITTSYDEWRDSIEKTLSDVKEMKSLIFLNCFKDCLYYQTEPVAMFDNKTIYAKSFRIVNDKEVVDFVKRKPNIIPYMFVTYDITYGNKKIFRFSDIGEI